MRALRRKRKPRGYMKSSASAGMSPQLSALSSAVIPESKTMYTVTMTASAKQLQDLAKRQGGSSVKLYHTNAQNGVSLTYGTPDVMERSARIVAANSSATEPFLNGHLVKSMRLVSAHNAMPFSLVLGAENIVAAGRFGFHGNSNSPKFIIPSGATLTDITHMLSNHSLNELMISAHYGHKNIGALDEGVEFSTSSSGRKMASVPHTSDSRHPAIDLFSHNALSSEKLQHLVPEAQHARNRGKAFVVPAEYFRPDANNAGRCLIDADLFSEFCARFEKGYKQRTPPSDVSNPIFSLSRIAPPVSETDAPATNSIQGGTARRTMFGDLDSGGLAGPEASDHWLHMLEPSAGRTNQAAQERALTTPYNFHATIEVTHVTPADIQTYLKR